MRLKRKIYRANVNENADVEPENLPGDANISDENAKSDLFFNTLEKYYIPLPNDGGWKSFNVSGKNLEKFKSDYPDARTEQGWKDYADEQKRKIANYNKRIKEAEDAQEKKRLEDEQAETERREKITATKYR